jgi:anhydro-N-acetylmuramic acid kinase
MATLAAFTAKSIAEAVSSDCRDATHIYVSGGGAYNSHLLSLLQSYLPNLIIQETSVLGVNPDAKEAMLFALLANELIGGSNTLGGTTMGKISLPN